MLPGPYETAGIPARSKNVASSTAEKPWRTTGSPAARACARSTVRAIEFIGERPEQWPADGVIHLSSTLNYRILDVARLVASRAAAMLGKTPEIVTAAPIAETPSPSVQFSIERLTAMGFAWTNDAAAEVDGTLRVCLEHRDRLMAQS